VLCNKFRRRKENNLQLEMYNIVDILDLYEIKKDKTEREREERSGKEEMM